MNDIRRMDLTILLKVCPELIYAAVGFFTNRFLNKCSELQVITPATAETVDAVYT
jgi:hypothetical protein